MSLRVGQKVFKYAHFILVDATLSPSSGKAAALQALKKGLLVPPAPPYLPLPPTSSWRNTRGFPLTPGTKQQQHGQPRTRVRRLQLLQAAARAVHAEREAREDKGHQVARRRAGAAR